MTPLAAVSWAAQLRWPQLRDSYVAFMGAPVTAYLFTVFAAAELVVDKLPFTPSRLKAGGLGARIVSGALCGATLCLAANASAAGGALLGAIGGVVGAYGGYHARVRLGRQLPGPDFVKALIEDAIAIGGAMLLVTRI
jgi:uncharacterized membrane protein